MRFDPTRQRGVALAVCLVFTAALTILGITSINQSQQRERMSASYRQQVDALAAAESAVHRAIALAQSSFPSGIPTGVSDQTVTDTWRQALGAANDGGLEVDSSAVRARYVLNESYWDGEHLRVTARGEVGKSENGAWQGRASRTLRTLITPPAAATASSGPFEEGVVGCEEISLGGGPRVDSYNSDYGAYGDSVTRDGSTFDNRYEGGESDFLDGASVRTLNEGADVSLSGNAPIFGPLTSTGDLMMYGQTPVYGDVRVQGDANLNGDIRGDLSVGGSAYLGNASLLSGDAAVGGDFVLNGQAQGSISAGGNAEFTNSSQTGGQVVSGGDVNVGSTSNPPPGIAAAGDVSYPGWWQWDQSKSEIADGYREGVDPAELGIPDIPPVYDPTVPCDPLQVTDPETDEPGEMFDEAWADPRMTPMAEWLEGDGCSHCYTEGGGGFSFTGGMGNQDASNTTVGTPGRETVLRVDGDVDTGGRLNELTIEGHVTLVVDGDFDLGNNTTLNLGPDATLTLMVTGQSRFGGGSDLLSDGQFVRVGADGEPRPAVSLYSAHGEVGGGPNNAGVTVSGANDAYMAVYAPNTDVVLTGSGDIFGSVRVAVVDMRGSGDIHYDEALRRVEGGGGVSVGAATPARVRTWWEGS